MLHLTRLFTGACCEKSLSAKTLLPSYSTETIHHAALTLSGLTMAEIAHLGKRPSWRHMHTFNKNMAVLKRLH